MTSPSLVTIKRLFAQSHNVCAFEGCQQPLIAGSTVVGEICHITAASPGGPRFDAGMSDVDRSSFENLVLMCPTHHRIIDSEPTRYSAEKLAEMKRQQMAQSGPELSISDEVARQLQAISTVTVQSVISVNQSGGQTAHTIHNHGPAKRTISDAVRAQMLTVLQPNPSTIGFASTQGDVEADAFKRQLMDVFRLAGWTVQDRWTFMFFGAKTGVVVTIPRNAPESGLPQVVAQALAATGTPVSGNRGDMADDCGIYVQVWPAPL